MPGVVLVDGLKVVRTEHEDYQREGRVDLHALLDAVQCVAPWLERIVPRRSAAVEAVFDHTDLVTGIDERPLHDAGPALVERETTARVRDDSPRQRITVDQDLQHLSRFRMARSNRQCLKCRRPVNTIARPCSSAAAMTSASFIDPPGWTTAVAPADATESRPSRNGKNASDAATDPRNVSPLAFMRATFTASTRLIWPAPIASVRLALVKMTVFDFTCAHSRQAKRSAVHSSVVGCRLVTTRRSFDGHGAEASTTRSPS